MGSNLSEAQLEDFLAGYRSTFETNNQGQALKQLYRESARRYDISIDALRRILGKELETNPRPYRALRNQLTVRKSAKKTKKAAPEAPQSAKPPPTAANERKCPACGQIVRRIKKGRLTDHNHNGSLCSGKAAACSVCKEVRPLRRGSRRLAIHTRENGRRCAGSDLLPLQPTVKAGRKAELRCPVCGQPVRRTENGTVVGHNSNGTDWCAGSGMKVTRPDPSRTKADDRSKSRSVRTTSAGLGSLGKR